MKNKMSERGGRLLGEWEGVEALVYLDSAGLPTIGVGHLLTHAERSSGKVLINGISVRYADGLSMEQIHGLLDQDLDRFERAVNRRVRVPLEQHQFDALVSFCFNIGATAFRNSTLVKRLNITRYDDVPAQLRRWIYSGGRKIPGLVNRREKEIRLWNSAD